ncbi:MAG: class IV adenylate cyclase [Sedimentisphaerales bacterium]|nr:class IV adenylate cyclase [Sedimentisphaerales bacterium]
MSIEIEAKLKVDSLEEIQRKLTALGAEFGQEQLQTDYHFDDMKMTLHKTDCCLRVRRQLVNKNERFFLTYKGAKEKSLFKKRQEIEIEIADSDSILNLLSALGYEKVLTIEKKRLTWHLGDCIIALDELPLIGSFVEIEGPDEQKIAAVQKNLGLSGSPHIKKSYAALIKATLKKLGKEQKEVFLQT